MKQAVKTLRLKVQTHANKTGEARGGVALVALWMSGAIVSFSTMAIAGRAVSDELDAVEILLYRSIFGLGIVLDPLGRPPWLLLVLPDPYRRR